MHPSRVVRPLPLVLLICGSLIPLPAQEPGAEAAAPRIEVGPFSFPRAKEWKVTKPSSAMRVAQVELPQAAEGGEAAELVVFHFGARQGGSVAQNLTRWKGQFERPEGLSDEEFSSQEERTVDGLAVTILRIRGKYTPTAFPGQPPPTAIEDARLFAVIVETEAGSYFIKASGPRATIDHHRKSLEAIATGIRKKPTPTSP